MTKKHTTKTTKAPKAKQPTVSQIIAGFMRDAMDEIIARHQKENAELLAKLEAKRKATP